MATKHFEGDLNGLLPKHLDLIAEILEKRGISDAKVFLESVGKPGDNYQGTIKRIIANHNYKSYKMIIKTAITAPQIREFMKTDAMYRNEVVMCREVLPKFTELEKQANVPEKERYRYAACYGTLMEEPSEAIVLEDLSAIGFTIPDRFKSLPNETMKLIINNLAKLHALSFVLKHKEPQTFKILSEKMSVIHELMEEDTRETFYSDFIVRLESNYLNILDNEKYKKAIKGKFSDMFEFTKVFKDNEDTVIIHNDCWSNNIMLQFDNENILQKCSFVDYQLARGYSPVWDIYQLLFYNTDYQTRAKHFEEWLELYYADLENYLGYFGLRAENIYSKEKLKLDLKRYGKYAFPYTLFALNFFVKDDSDAIKVKEAMEKDKGMEAVIDSMDTEKNTYTNINLLKERIEGLVDSFLDLGILNSN